MDYRKIGKKDIGKLLKEWSREFTLFVPSREGDAVKMAGWNGKDTDFLDRYRNTVIPAKAIFFPQMEELFSFQKSRDGSHIEPPVLGEQNRLVFGIRPCDAKALAMLDMTFEDAYEDPYYLSKRRNTVLVGIGCTRPYDTCFCTSLGSSPTDSKYVDIMFIDIGDEFFIEEVTDKGRELISLTGWLAKATEVDEIRVREAKEAAYNKVTRILEINGIEDRLLTIFDDSEYWEKIAAKCLSCGICTYLCPTCYCFDMNDELVKEQGTRFRSWDSCGFSIYTRMPAENPRLEKWRRVRQRVCHKFEFYPMTFGVIACTGCGRCIRLCPVNWDIIQTLQSIPVKA